MKKEKGQPIVKLRDLRINNKYSYQDMADKLGICKAYYWQIENGNRNLYYSLAKKIAKIFNLRPDDIFYINKQK